MAKYRSASKNVGQYENKMKLHKAIEKQKMLIKTYFWPNWMQSAQMCWFPINDVAFGAFHLHQR